MSCTLLDKWLLHYDSVHRGWTRAGIANGVCATCGFSFPRIRGGYLLRRAVGRAPDESSEIVGAAGADADSVGTFPWIVHAANTTYVYGLSAISGGGVENRLEQSPAAARFDELGRWTGELPNAPADLRADAAEGGTFRVRWSHCGEDEQARPAGFRIYHDAGMGTIDYRAVVAVVGYRRGQVNYEYISLPFGHDVRVRWAVRAFSVNGVEELNEQTADGVARAHPPPAPAVVLAGCSI